MHKPATKADLQQAVADVGHQFSEVLRTHSNAMTERFDKIDGQFTEVNAKLDAILEMVAVRQELRALVGQLRAKGIELDESKIFVA